MNNDLLEKIRLKAAMIENTAEVATVMTSFHSIETIKQFAIDIQELIQKERETSLVSQNPL